MNIHCFYELVTKILTGEASENEKRIFDEYLCFPEYQAIYKLLRKEWEKELNIQLDEFNLEKGLNRLREKISKSDNLFAKKKTIRRRKVALLSVAAIVLALLAIGIVWPDLQSEPDILRFAETTQRDITTGDTRLILEDQNEVVITSDDSQIDYTSLQGNVIVTGEERIEHPVTDSPISYNTVIVPYGKRSKVILADQSEVWLNSGSRLIYPADFSAAAQREVFLEGEALFEVKPQDNKPFIVRTREIEIKVLGTVFNVSAYSDDSLTETVLEKGSVTIRSVDFKLLKQPEISILPGTLAQYSSATKKIIQQQVCTERYTSWHNGYLLYEQEPLSNIVKKLSRYYVREVKLGTQSLGLDTFSGKLELKTDVQEVLETIAFVSSLQIEKRNNELILKK